HTTVAGGIVAQGSDLIMTGGGVAGDVPLDLDDSRFDLAGVMIETAAEKPYRVGPGSRLLLSVCPWEQPGSAAPTRYLQGFYGGPPAPAK
ncbi:MAG TPA: hypothetical protein VMU50_13135, partial [Polyangia bacterium]|nr:hypothetical protein [Polyangia bacterium]